MSAVIVHRIRRELKEVIKGLSDEQVDLNILGGSAVLRDIEFSEHFCNVLLRASMPAFQVQSAKCSYIRIQVPWTRLGTEPILVQLGTVVAVVEESETVKAPVLGQPSNTSSRKNSYSFFSKLIDSLSIQVEEIIVHIAFGKIKHAVEGAVDPWNVQIRAKKCSFFQTDENGNKEIVFFRQKRNPLDSDLLSDIIIHKLFVCESCKISLISPEAEKESVLRASSPRGSRSSRLSSSRLEFDLFRRTPMSIRMTLRRSCDGLLHSLLSYIYFESVQIVLTQPELEETFNVIMALIHALCRPMDSDNDEADARPSSETSEADYEDKFDDFSMETESSFFESRLDKSKDVLKGIQKKLTSAKSGISSKIAGIHADLKARKAKLKELIMPEKQVTSLKESGEAASIFFQKAFTTVVLGIENLIIALRDGINTNTFAISGFNGGLLSMWAESSPDKSAYESFLSCTLNRMVLVGRKDVLIEDDCSKAKQVWVGEKSRWPTLKHPLPVTDSDTMFYVEMRWTCPALEAPSVNSVTQIIIGGLEMTLHLEEWHALLSLLVTSRTVSVLQDYRKLWDKLYSGIEVHRTIWSKMEVVASKISLIYPSHDSKFLSSLLISDAFVSSVPEDMSLASGYSNRHKLVLRCKEVSGTFKYLEAPEVYLIQCTSLNLELRTKLLILQIQSFNVDFLESAVSAFITSGVHSSNVLYFQRSLIYQPPKNNKTLREFLDDSLRLFSLDMKCNVNIDVLKVLIKDTSGNSVHTISGSTLCLRVFDVLVSPCRHFVFAGSSLKILTSFFPVTFDWREFQLSGVQQFGKGRSSRFQISFDKLDNADDVSIGLDCPNREYIDWITKTIFRIGVDYRSLDDQKLYDKQIKILEEVIIAKESEMEEMKAAAKKQVEAVYVAWDREKTEMSETYQSVQKELIEEIRRLQDELKKRDSAKPAK